MNKARIFLAAFGLAFLVIMITSVNRIIEIENSKPIETKTIPISKKTLLALPAAALMPESEIVPEYPYKNAAPNKKNAEE